MRSSVSRPFFSYLGSKFRLASRGVYMPPRHRMIIEPFAGSAGYSCAFPYHQVVLIDKYEPVVATWRYLISAKESEILKLPDVGDEGVAALPSTVAQEAKWLIGFWLDTALSRPRNIPSAYAKSGEWPEKFWGEKVRRSVARNLRHIRHWSVWQGDYRTAPDYEATWFIDPPYQAMTGGACYPEGNGKLDYLALAEWCRGRRGDVTVCEGDNATWLPFIKVGVTDGAPKSRKAAKLSSKQRGEYVWPPSSVRQLQLDLQHEFGEVA